MAGPDAGSPMRQRAPPRKRCNCGWGAKVLDPGTSLAVPDPGLSGHFPAESRRIATHFGHREVCVDSAPKPPLLGRSYPASGTNARQLPCPDGGIGRRTSFRCWRSQGRGGSSPLLGTIFLPDASVSVRKSPLSQALFTASASAGIRLNSLKLTVHYGISDGIETDRGGTMLTDLAVRKTAPRDKPNKLSDGGGL